MKKIALFPGSFDPFTKGHEAIVHKALNVFDHIVIAIGENTSKQSLFSIEKRINHITAIFENNKAVSVEKYSGLTVNFCEQEGIKHIIRGLRDTKDFQYERSIAHMNFELGKIETVFFLTDLHLSAINSSIVREIAKSKGSIDQFVTRTDLLV
ncbi:MAG: pantetheine-phosphate adenylyltransferase [Flavobacteriia bacterium]|nr:pantetheine-phosphate adenylyltransferase [Flavobacteriia bacterium]